MVNTANITAENIGAIQVFVNAHVKSEDGLKGNYCFDQTNIIVGQPIPTTTPAPDWYSPSFGKCENADYMTYYSEADCMDTDILGYSGELESPHPCSADGSGQCFKVYGSVVDPSTVVSQKLLSDNLCSDIDSPIFSPVYDKKDDCSWGVPPPAEINGQIIINVADLNKFDKAGIWLRYATTNNNVILDWIEIPKDKIGCQTPNNYIFRNLNYDTIYEVYPKVYDASGQEIIVNMTASSPTVDCGGSGTCSLNAPGEVNLTIDFLNDVCVQGGSGELLYQSTNRAFQLAIDKWQADEMSALEMSEFIARITRTPGLQKAVCNPKIPGGCVAPK